ncbi:Uncharacterised protein [BD1-7 clade bacterium]|uniref:Uncharacterized protein n=1 Tax=BD1-7 clade bacterium TaxID=2029982 RepID=A0A5S9P287_9GAMM|nr:Uncharacterised protein [BD1-7 clade bacterium]
MPKVKSEASKNRDAPYKKPAPSSEELALKEALHTPCDMDEELELFLKYIFEREDLMSQPENLDTKIYAIYSQASNRKGMKISDFKRFYLDLWRLLRSDPQMSSAIFQYTDLKLSDVISTIEAKRKLPIEIYSDFLYFHLGVLSPQYRVYANACLDRTTEFIAWVLQYKQQHPNHQICGIKLASPLLKRADSIVFFCVNRDAAMQLTQAMTHLIGVFEKSIPAMTTRIQDGVGISIGAEPDQIRTGLAANELEIPVGAAVCQSFGTIRAQLIKGAALNYNENKQQYGESFDSFKRFVVAAFRGYGLDPSKKPQNE